MNDLPDIRRVLEHYGVTFRSSSTAVRCPFHNDRHASAGINVKDNLFNCLACGAKGNSLQVIAQKEGISVREAASFAEGITGERSPELHGKYSSGSRLPGKQGYHKGSSTAGAIRRSRAS